MGLSSGTIDKAISVAGGAAGLAFASATGPIGLAVSGVGLVRGVFADRAGGDPTKKTVLKKLRNRVRDGYDAWLAADGHGMAHADLASADRALDENLAALFVDRAVLAGCARASEGFVTAAGAHIIARLAEADPQFAATRDGQAPLARDYAALVVRLALEAAVEDAAWFAKLEPHLLIDLAQTVGATLAAAERVEEKVDQAEATAARRHEALMAAVTAEKGVPLDAVRAIAAGFGAVKPDARADELRSYLEAKAIEFHALLARLDALTSRSNRSSHLTQRAREALVAGRFDEVEAVLLEAEDLDDELIEDLLIAKAGKRALRAEAAALRADFPMAIRLYDEAHAMLPPAVRDTYHYDWRAAETAHECGERFGRLPMLTDAALRWLRIGDGRPRDIAFAKAQLGLGGALLVLGQNLVAATGLRYAIVSFRVAQGLYGEGISLSGSAVDIVGWANAEYSLAGARAALGVRRGDRRLLRRAKRGFRRARKLVSRLGPDLPLSEMTVSLAWTRLMLAELTRSEVPLRAAMRMYEKALMELGDPPGANDGATAAMLRSGLGAALTVLAGWRGDRHLAECAASALLEAAAGQSAEREPLEWARTTQRLGNAWRTVAELGGGEQAAAASYAALVAAGKMFDRANLPIEWAENVANKGHLLVALSRLRRDPNAAAAAARHFTAAMKVFVHPELSGYRAGAERGLDAARSLMFELPTG